MIVWNLGTGAFNPFFSAFFVHLSFSTERIGMLFSSVHLAQALAMLAAPIAIHRLGLARGISTMQFATALIARRIGDVDRTRSRLTSPTALMLFSNT